MRNVNKKNEKRDWRVLRAGLRLNSSRKWARPDSSDETTTRKKTSKERDEIWLKAIQGTENGSKVSENERKRKSGGKRREWRRRVITGSKKGTRRRVRVTGSAKVAEDRPSRTCWFQLWSTGDPAGGVCSPETPSAEKIENSSNRRQKVFGRKR